VIVVLARVATDLPVPGNDPSSVRSLTKGILADPQFRAPRRGVLAAAWHWLTTELGKVLTRIFGGGPGGSGWVALAAVIVVAVAVIVLVILTARGAGRGARRGRLPAVVVRGAGPSRSPAEWRMEAAAHEAAGRWRDGLRCRYRALVAELAGRGIVEEIPGRTSGEYRRDVGAAVPNAASAFDGATRAFEEAWYGARPIGPGDPAAFEDLSQRVLSDARTAVAVGGAGGSGAAPAPQPVGGAR
jgi:hypothetical protein